MIKRLLIIFLFFPLVVLGQSDTIIKGKIVSTSSSLEGIHVLNINANNGVATDSRGYFTIKANSNDTLQFTAIHLIAKRYIVSKNDFGEDFLFIEMKSKLTELDEVTIVQYKNINAVALGIVPANQKTYTPAERKLAAAEEFHWYSPLLIPLGGMSVDGLINSVSGRTSMLKKELVVERKEFLLSKISEYYEREYFTKTLKIPADYVDGFLYHVVENEKFTRAMRDKNKTMASFVLSELAVEYLKLNELEISKNKVDEK